jgi:hypothetical protein
MIALRPFASLGKLDLDWLAARYHFSFSNYYDPTRMSHGALRVWNDDTIQPRSGFAPHPHNDMEIITYVRKGAITHRDSLGNEGRTEAGDVQVMSAGTGIRHSEWNAEDTSTTLFQIWIEPRIRGAKPNWGTRPFPKAGRENSWSVLASGFAGDDALPINQDARILGATLTPGNTLTHTVEAGRHVYLVLAQGQVKLNGHSLEARDGAAITGPEKLELTASDSAEIVLVDTV